MTDYPMDISDQSMASFGKGSMKIDSKLSDHDIAINDAKRDDISESGVHHTTERQNRSDDVSVYRNDSAAKILSSSIVEDVIKLPVEGNKSTSLNDTLGNISSQNTNKRETITNASGIVDNSSSNRGSRYFNQRTTTRPSFNRRVTSTRIGLSSSSLNNNCSTSPIKATNESTDEIGPWVDSQRRGFWSSVDEAIAASFNNKNTLGHARSIPLEVQQYRLPKRTALTRLAAKSAAISASEAEKERQRHEGELLGSNVLQTSMVNKAALKNFSIIDPNSKMKLLWDIFVAFLIVYSVIVIPYRIGFEITSSGPLTTFDSLIDIIFLIDIIINFNCAQEDRQSDMMIVSRREIAKNYLQFWFWVDALSTIPFDTVISFFIGSNNRALSSVRLLRSIRLTRLIKLIRVAKLGRIGEQIENLNLNPALYGMVKIVITIWFIAHILCCFWYNIAFHHQDNDLQTADNNWLYAGGFTVLSLKDKYVASFYFIITSMLAIGYGDIHAENTTEMIYAMVVMIVGSIMFGGVIAQVNRLIESSDPSGRAFRNRMNEMRIYLAEKNLPRNLRVKATNAYRYYLRKRSVFYESSILADLPTSLLSTLITMVYEEQRNKIVIFKMLKEPFVVRILMYFKPFQASVGERIIKRNDVVEELVFIMKGFVQFSTSDNGIDSAVTGYSTDGDFFGDFEYYRRSNRFLDYLAMNSCNLLAISVKRLDEALADYPDSAQLFHQQLQTRYEHFIIAKNSPSYLKAAGVRMRRALWVNGSVIDGEIEALDHTNQRKIAEFSASNSDSPSPGVRSDKYKISSTSNNNSFSNHVSDESSYVNRTAEMDSDVYMSKIENIAIASKTIIIRVQTIDEEENEDLFDVDINEILKVYHVIAPMLSYKLNWDAFVGILILFSIIVIPVQVGFDTTSTGSIFILERVIDGMFFLDMIISFRTAYFDEVIDAVVVVPKLIVNRYMNTWFVIDFFSTVPFDIIFDSLLSSQSNSLRSIKLLKVARLLRLLKLARFAKLRKYVVKLEDALGINPVMLELFKLVLQVIFISHLTACFFWYTCSIMTVETWYDEINLQVASLFRQYVTTLYWSITTLATVGYGDIVPINTAERLVTIVIMLLGATVFGYIVSNVSGLMGSFNIASQKMNEKVGDVEGYLIEKAVPDSIGLSVVKHIKHTFSQSSVDENSILILLPIHISRQITRLHYSEALQNISIFKYINNNGVILHIFGMMAPAYYDVNDHILRQGTMASDVMFIISGKAEIVKVTRVVKSVSSTTKKESTGMSIRSMTFKKLMTMKNIVAPSIETILSPKGSRSKLTGKPIQKPSTAMIHAEISRSVDADSTQSSHSRSIPSSVHIINNEIDGESEHLSNSSTLRRFHRNSRNYHAVEDTIPTQDSSDLTDLDHILKSHSIEPQLREDMQKPQQLNLAPISRDGLALQISTASDEIASEPPPLQDTRLKSLNQRNTATRIPLRKLRREATYAVKLEEVISHNPICKIGPGSMCGHISLMTRTKLRASVIAVLPCSVYQLSELDVTNIVRDLPSVALILKRSFAQAIMAQRSFAKQKIKRHRSAFLQQLDKDFHETNALKNDTKINNSTCKSINDKTTKVKHKPYHRQKTMRFDTAAEAFDPNESMDPTAMGIMSMIGVNLPNLHKNGSLKTSRHHKFSVGKKRFSLYDSDEEDQPAQHTGIVDVTMTVIEDQPGQLTARVRRIHCQNLVNVEMIGQNDPFVVITFGDNGPSFKTTTLEDHGSEALWIYPESDPSSMIIQGSVAFFENTVMHVKVFDENTYVNDVLIGEGFTSMVALSNIASTVQVEYLLTFQLMNKKNDNQFMSLREAIRSMPKRRSMSCPEISANSELLNTTAVTAMQPFQLLTNVKKSRRMSFPSYDNKVWREDRLKSMMI